MINNSEAVMRTSPGTQYVLHPQVAMNILILIGMTTERVCWMYLFSFSGCFN